MCAYEIELKEVIEELIKIKKLDVANEILKNVKYTFSQYNYYSQLLKDTNNGCKKEPN